MISVRITKLFLASFLSLFLFQSATAQNQPSPLLSSADVELFLKSFNPLKNDLEKLGHSYENMNQNTITALKANEEVKATFKKHGWSDDYFPKINAIVYAYSYLKMMQEMDKLPAEQKQTIGPVMQSMKTQFTNMVHDADIQLVKGKFAAVDKFFEEQK